MHIPGQKTVGHAIRWLFTNEASPPKMTGYEQHVRQTYKASGDIPGATELVILKHRIQGKEFAVMIDGQKSEDYIGNANIVLRLDLHKDFDAQWQYPDGSIHDLSDLINHTRSPIEKTLGVNKAPAEVSYLRAVP